MTQLLCLWDASWFDISINHGVCAHLEQESEPYCSLGGMGKCHLHRDQTTRVSGVFPMFDPP
jgi:hypothetical protein